MERIRVHRAGKPGWLASLPGSDTSEHRVCELLPPGYEGYVRVFHPFIRWGADPVRAGSEGRTTWRELARQIGVDLTPTLQWDTLRPALPIEDDRRRYEVHMGEIEPVTRERLFALLQRHATAGSAYFLYDLSAIVAGRDPVTVEAAVGDYKEVFRWADETDAAAVSTPEYVWPSDRAWIVCCDFDLSSTYIAGSSALCAELVESTALETVEVGLDTRIDYKADADRRPG